MIKILLVCMGNICRSPAAEGILRSKLEKLGKVEGKDFEVDSAGTTGYHQGSAPDVRSQHITAKNGIDISKQVSRPLVAGDGEKFDMIICMDSSNLTDVKHIIKKEYHSKVSLLDSKEVEDPYHRNDGFDRMYDHINLAVDKLITKMRV